MTVDETPALRSIENVEASRSRVCLFGPPDKEVGEQLQREQFAADACRFVDKWGYDVVKGEPFKRPRGSPRRPAGRRNKENQNPVASPRKSLKMSSERSYAAARQSQMTEYWNYRKLSESSCSDKEN